MMAYGRSIVPLVEGPTSFQCGADGAGGGSIANGARRRHARHRSAFALPAGIYDGVLRRARDDPENGRSRPSTGSPPMRSKGSSCRHLQEHARFSWTTPPSPTVLATTNPDNIPSSSCGSDGITQAPRQRHIRSASGRFLCRRSGPVAEPRQHHEHAYFDVPLSANTVPAIATSPGAPPRSPRPSSTQLETAERSTDPRHVHRDRAAHRAEDTAYSTYNDPKSTYPLACRIRTDAVESRADRVLQRRGQARSIRRDEPVPGSRRDHSCDRTARLRLVARYEE
jgi:hypothetical protein